MSSPINLLFDADANTIDVSLHGTSPTTSTPGGINDPQLLPHRQLSWPNLQSHALDNDTNNSNRTGSIQQPADTATPFRDADKAIIDTAVNKFDSINHYNIDTLDNDLYPRLAIPPWLPHPLPPNEHIIEYIEHSWNSYHTYTAQQIGTLGDYVESFVRSHPASNDNDMLNDNTRNARIRGYIIYDARVRQWYSKLVPNRVEPLMFWRNYATHCNAIINGEQAFLTHKQYMSKPVDKELGPLGTIGSIHFQHTLSALNTVSVINRNKLHRSAVHRVANNMNNNNDESHSNQLSLHINNEYSNQHSVHISSKSNKRHPMQSTSAHHSVYDKTHRSTNNYYNNNYPLPSNMFDLTALSSPTHHTDDPSVHDEPTDVTITDIYDRQMQHINSLNEKYNGDTADDHNTSAGKQQINDRRDIFKGLASLGQLYTQHNQSKQQSRHHLFNQIYKLLAVLAIVIFMFVLPITLMLIFYLDIIQVVESGVAALIAPVIIWFISFYRLQRLPGVITLPTEQQKKSWKSRIDIYLQWIWLISQDYVYESYHLCVTLLACASYLWYSYHLEYTFTDPLDQVNAHYILQCSNDARYNFIQVEYFLVLSLSVDYTMRFLSSPHWWNYFKSRYSLIDLSCFICVAYASFILLDFEPSVLHTSYYNIYLFQGWLRFLRLRRAVMSLDHAHIVLHNKTGKIKLVYMLGPLPIKPITARIILLCVRVALYILSTASLIMFFEYPCM